MWDNTQEWKEYQAGVDYNNKIGLYANTELNWNMYNGKQWIGVITNGLAKWTFNICRSAINYFIAFICSQKVKMQYSAENIPDEPTEENEIKIKEFVDLLSNMADMKWEKDKMDSKLRQLMLDGANTGDFCAYVYWDPKKETKQDEKGDFTTEVVDGINVMYGNPNNKDVEAQPYILIVGREMVSKLKKEAKENGISKEQIDSIVADTDTQYQAGANGKIELDNKDDNGKCNYIIKFWKKDNTVFWNKSTRYCPIRKEVDLGISRYPIAWGNWDSIKNSYHGMPVIEGIIDNQISINQLFALVSYWMKMSAFGKVVVDASRLDGPWSNKIGEAIKANGNVRDIVYQLQAGNFNEAILKVIDMAVKFTKEFIGANDTLLGQVNPEQASGIAIIGTAKQAAMPLGNIQANRDQFVEDLGLIWGEFFLKKYKNRKVSYRKNGKVVTEPYSTEGIDILLHCKVDVGPSSYWSEISGIQALDNLLKMGKITDIQYFERMAKMNIIPDVQGIIKDIKAMQEAQAQQAEIQNKQAQMAEFLKTQPPEVQQRIMQLPTDEEKFMAVQEMMGGVNNG